MDAGSGNDCRRPRLLGTAAVHSEPEFSEQASQKYSDDVGGARISSTIAPREAASEPRGWTGQLSLIAMSRGLSDHLGPPDFCLAGTGPGAMPTTHSDWPFRGNPI